MVVKICTKNPLKSLKVVMGYKSIFVSFNYVIMACRGLPLLFHLLITLSVSR